MISMFSHKHRPNDPCFTPCACQGCVLLTQAMYSATPCQQQLADFTDSPLDSFENKSVKEIKKLLKANSEDRSFLKSTDVDVAKVVHFCNYLPTFAVRFAVSADTVELGTSVTVDVEVSREYLNDDEKVSTDADGIPASFYPVKGKTDLSWIFIGSPERNTLCYIQQWKFFEYYKHSLEFVRTELGQQNYYLYLVNDSYLGVDEEFTFDIVVVEASAKRQ